MLGKIKASFIFLSYLFPTIVWFFCHFHILNYSLDFFEEMLNQRMLSESLMHNVLITHIFWIAFLVQTISLLLTVLSCSDQLIYR